MSGGTKPFGYTILEVMIVLGVSGMMFVMAGSFINGKQADAAFKAGVNDLAQIMQTAADNTLSGHYSDIPLTCNTAGVKTTAIAAGPTGVQSGQQPNCIFFGQKLIFNAAGRPSTEYKNYTLVGQRLNGSKTVVDRADAKVGEADALTVTGDIPQGLVINWVSAHEPPGAVAPDASKVNGVAFMQHLPIDDQLGGNTVKNGSRGIDLNYTSRSVGSETTQSSADNVTFCVTDGQRYAKISINGSTPLNATSIAVRTTMLGKTPC